MASKYLPSFDLRLILLCGLWYLTSVIASSSAKMILADFTYPVSLTEIQFVMNAIYCLLIVTVVRRVDSAMSVHRHSSYQTGGKFDSLYDESSAKTIVESFPKGTFPENLDSYNYSLWNNFLRPSTMLLNATLPMGIFQFLGQIAGHKATSVIPVSLVHTIKALSPLTTVLIYKFLFGKEFNLNTYLTLVPLILGVMLSCTRSDVLNHDDSHIYHLGCTFAFISMLIFVWQNIFAKRFLTYGNTSKEDEWVSAVSNRIMSKVHRSGSNLNLAEDKTPVLPVSMTFNRAPATPLYGNSSQSLNKLVKDSNTDLDKISVLFYCSIVGFGLTLPFYLVSEWSNETFSLSLIDRHILGLVLIYGTSHFMQSIVAFQILGLISPINYSIANIFKRIIVISVSIFLEGTQLSHLQWVGLFLTFSGLYTYDRWGVVRSKEAETQSPPSTDNGSYFEPREPSIPSLSPGVYSPIGGSPSLGPFQREQFAREIFRVPHSTEMPPQRPAAAIPKGELSSLSRGKAINI